MSQADLARRIGAVLPSGVEAVTGARLTAEQQAEVEGDLVDALELGLAAFAFVALVVAAFGIVNTFTILAPSGCGSRPCCGLSVPPGARC